ncbi:MAG: DNA-formamidopyrimidine glycosylase [Chloroflexota bacterium]
MPELPEVETIKNDLRELVLGRTVTAVDLRDPTLVRHPEPTRFTTRLEGQRLLDAQRKGKYLLLRLSSDDFLAIQLMITGQFLLKRPEDAVAANTRLILSLDDGRQLRLVDQNGYAKVSLVTEAETASVLGLDKLGPDPTSPDFTLATFRDLLQGRRGRIKSLLLDQHVLAGPGNIYVDEALFRARLHPARAANSLDDAEVARLYDALRHVLLTGIAKRGTTIATYRDVLGRPGHYQEELQVFRRTGKPCPGCGGKVVATKLGGRDTYYCPTCQPEP